MKFHDDFPLPDTEWPATRPYWAAAARGELAVPRCATCAHYVWYPGTCRFCGGERSTWTRLSGRGRLFAWSVVHRAFLPQFADQVPFVPSLVEIEEDPAVRLVTRMVDCDAAELRIGMPVTVVFRPLEITGVARKVMAPLFVPAPQPRLPWPRGRA